MSGGRAVRALARSLLLAAVAVALSAGGAAQSPCSLGSFEAGADGWVAGADAGGAGRVETSLNAPGVPFAGSGMLEWTTESDATLTTDFRTVYRIFETPLDLTETPLLTLAVNTYGRPGSPDYQARVRVWSGGVVGCGRYVGGVSAERTVPIERNAWTPLTVDLSGFEGLAAVDKIEVGVRLPGEDVSGWLGRHQLDAVEARVLAVDADPGPERAGVGVPYPNPATRRATIRVVPAGPGRVRVTVVDVLGRAVRTAHDGPLAGATDVAIDVAGLAAGPYAVVVVGSGAPAVRRLVVVR